MLDEFETCVSESIFRICNELIINKWGTHRIQQSVLVHTVDDESNSWRNHGGPPCLISRLSCSVFRLKHVEGWKNPVEQVHSVYLWPQN